MVVIFKRYSNNCIHVWSSQWASHRQWAKERTGQFIY